VGIIQSKNRAGESAVARVESLSHDGRGVAHIDGKATFIAGGLPGEEVRIIYTLRRRNLDEAEVTEVLQASPERVKPRCPQFGVCGGCSLQHLAPEGQVRAKEQALLDALDHIGRVTPEVVLEPLVGANPWGYRRKARLGTKYVLKKERVLVGFREKGSALVTDLARCDTLNPQVGERLHELAELIGSLSIRDRVPQIEVAVGDDACVLVFRILAPLSSEDRKRLLAFGETHGIHIYLQEGGLNTLRPLGEQAPELAYSLPEFGVKVRFQPTDFTQVNGEMNRLMVHRAIEMIDPRPEDRILDLFCGLGNFTLPLATRCHQVVGVEAEAGLIRRARENATLNGLENLRYFTADLYKPLDKEPWLRERFNKALLDPPRTGAVEVLHHLPTLGVERILYVSCYPGTLARDAHELVHRLGYRLRAAGVMDMFPHTAHVESMALFERA
jgi:23S rRNA (uracil1939-C5)-methyltransferase